MNKFKKILQDKVVQIVLLLCFVLFTTAAIATVYKNQSTKDTQPIQMDEPTKEAAKEDEGKQIAAESTAPDTTAAQPDAGQAALADSASQASDQNGGSEAANATIANSPVPALSFSDASKMMWPIQGNILMEYSMDTTVFYSTLKQYKVSPAVLIQGEVGAGVMAPAAAQVTEVGMNEEIGNYVTLNLGSGYQATLGNLNEVTVIQGQYVEPGNILGVISQPTAYYSVEGANLYFQLKNGDQPVDPLNYLE